MGGGWGYSPSIFPFPLSLGRERGTKRVRILLKALSVV